MIAIQFFNEGLMHMKMLAFKDLLRHYCKVEPQLAQTYSTMAIFPQVLKLVFGIIIDAKLVSKRKYYLIAMGVI